MLLDVERTMSELGKPFLQNSDRKNKKKSENLCQNAASENKKTTSKKCKIDSNKELGLELPMTGLGKPFRKNSDEKIEMTAKIKVKLPHVNKKPLARNQIFAQTPFSHCTLKLERKSFTPKNHSRFRSTSCFIVNKMTTPI